jgi:3-isopropylmalate/(R)-2-methylmalate dehydratase small subunit
MVAGPRFGTGSSREHAVWALMDYGFEVIISSSFGDIFRNNSSKQGLVIAQLPGELVEELQAIIEQSPQTHVVVDVQNLRVEVPEFTWSHPFAMDALTQERLLQGWDDIGLTLRQAQSIDQYESTHQSHALNSALLD